MEAIRQAGHEEAVVVTHGRLLVVTLQALVGLPDQQPGAALQNGSITRLSFNADGRAVLLSLDDVDHLRDVGLAGRGDL